MGAAVGGEQERVPRLEPLVLQGRRRLGEREPAQRAKARPLRGHGGERRGARLVPVVPQKIDCGEAAAPPQRAGQRPAALAADGICSEAEAPQRAVGLDGRGDGQCARVAQPIAGQVERRERRRAADPRRKCRERGRAVGLGRLASTVDATEPAVPQDEGHALRGREQPGGAQLLEEQLGGTIAAAVRPEAQ